MTVTCDWCNGTGKLKPVMKPGFPQKFIGCHACKGKGTVLDTEWSSQINNDPDPVVALKCYGDPDTCGCKLHRDARKSPLIDNKRLTAQDVADYAGRMAKAGRDHLDTLSKTVAEGFRMVPGDREKAPAGPAGEPQATCPTHPGDYGLNCRYCDIDHDNYRAWKETRGE